MKRLTLMRHANAKWNDREVSDFERPLNRRGNAEAEAIARRLLELDLTPALILASSALRSRQTAEIVAKELKVATRHVRTEEALYLARAKDILKAVHSTGPRVPHLMVIGHNPGISRLAHDLGASLDDEDLATGAICSLSFDARVWSDVNAGALRDSLQEDPPSRLFSALWA